jgi:hypothetical protein
MLNTTKTNSDNNIYSPKDIHIAHDIHNEQTIHIHPNINQYTQSVSFNMK